MIIHELSFGIKVYETSVDSDIKQVLDEPYNSSTRSTVEISTWPDLKVAFSLPIKLIS